MDPTATLTEILESLHSWSVFVSCPGRDNYEYAQTRKNEGLEGLESLAQWIRKGGFPPDVRAAINKARISG